ncbi:MAG TPA: sugar phosphate isomerase/epimerase [Planctomycetaceae bacterium]|nr:sugar phosphate isomerase/epimerase [Planctomycetaceae bacterium]
MHRLKIALATRILKQPLRQALVAVARAGAGGVQLDARSEVPPVELSRTGRRELVKQLSDLHLSVASVHVPTRRALSDEAYLEYRLDLIRDAMQLAYDLKSGVVTVRMGALPDPSDTGPYSLLIDVLNDLARFGNRVGAVLAVTPASEDPGRLGPLLAHVKEGPIGLDFDPTVFVAGPQSPSDAFRQLHQWVRHVQVRDAVRDMDGTVLEVPVGRGDVAWDELLALLEEADYRGWLTVIRTAGDDRAGDATRAVQYLRNVAADL